ncbi:glycosyltransferase [Algoriphagus aquimarinus]|uniref:Glycosyltransferase n=1 Tax=Algoriphagus aquimarinus TaxID=237018 RepID=A0A5C7ARV7_9BACT|nr:glycosyltransferase [Algoriphagus aquimarinus]TXE11496.1 glycosyltransferase [Algoriphagus aquimarinus]
MKLNLYSFSIMRGGAGLAAKKFKTLSENILRSSVLIVCQDSASGFQFFKRLISFALLKLQFDGNPIKHSLNLFSYGPVLNSFKNLEKLHHIHWINNDTLSVFDFDKIPAGSIITLHDEWLYCGAEHCYNVKDENLDFVNGYFFLKKGTLGIHWNYIIWKIKLKKLSYRSDLIYTVPSTWMLERAKRSLILRNADVRLLPNPIDTDVFCPVTFNFLKKYRRKLGLSVDDFVLCYGAVGGKASYYKGSHLLEEALRILHKSISEINSKKIKIVIFGGKWKGTKESFGFKTYSLGHIANPAELALLYASIDCVVVPSLVESFGQVAAESMACGTPVVSFDCSGLKDIVIDGATGLLAQNYSADDLAAKLKIILMMSSTERKALGKKGREHVVNNFSYSVIEDQYKSIINDAALLKKQTVIPK